MCPPPRHFPTYPESLMFNRSALYFGGDTHRHHHTHVEMVDPSVEKGARFLNEIEEKAADRVLQTMLVGTKGFDSQFIMFEKARNIATMSTETFVAFSVNGRLYQERISTPDAWGARQEEAVTEAFHNIATAITAQLMTELFEKHHWHGQPY